MKKSGSGAQLIHPATQQVIRGAFIPSCVAKTQQPALASRDKTGIALASAARFGKMQPASGFGSSRVSVADHVESLKPQSSNQKEIHMQKKIIALAVAGLVSGAAFAQSNVTIYGVADATFDNVKVSGTGSSEPGHNRVSTNSSYIGFKGVEDLGGGLKAVFQLEGGASFDGAGGFSFNRDSYAGIAGNFGTIAMGNLTGPTRALGAALDVFSGATGIGANSGIIGKFGGLLSGVTTDANGSPTYSAPARSSTQTSTFDTRWKNAIAYISPSFSGLTVVAAYVANENKTDATNAYNDTYGYDIGVNYANGPLMVGLTYNKANVNNTATISTLPFPANTLTDISAADTRLGASYDFGVVKVNALYDRVKVEATGFGEHQNTWGLGVQVPVGPGKIVGQYYKAGDISGSGNDNTGAKLWAVGYEHSMSKRTILKATYAHLKADDYAIYGFGVNGMAVTAGDKSTGFQIGLRHTF
jgi:predicted porin